MNQFCSVCILAILLLFNVTIQAQPFFNFQQKSNHSRPFIQLDSVKNTAFESGRIYVKFTANFSIEKQQQANYLSLFSNNTLLKNLQKQFKVQHTHSMFPYILEDIERAELHKSWGFNRWFEIEFDSSFSVKDVVKTYQQTGIFEIVEPVYKTELIGATEYIPNDPFFSQQWHFKNTGQGGGTIGKDIQLTKAWEIEKGKPSVLISIHDNALQLDHVDLAQNIAVGKSYNFTDNSPNLTLNSGHGTFCAGIFGAVNNNNIGVSSIAGGNGNSNSGIRIMSCQTFSRTRNTGFAESFIYAADNGAAISSNSWGYVDFDVYNMAVLDAIDYFCDNGGGSVMQGGLVVFAAGNNGLNKKIYPGAYERVICVAASNNKDEKANYSNFGDWVDITAPGGEFSGATGILSLNNFDGYSSSGGTSNACPQVVGVAGLVTSILSGRTSASDVAEIILSTTDDHYNLNQAYIGKLGTGRLNAFKAVTKAQQLFNNQFINPISNLSYTNDCNQVTIKYTKNNSNDDVMIVYNQINEIGIPVNGKKYSIGDYLPGGGKIVYIGSQQQYTFNLLNNGLWHYCKIFSVNHQNEYSFGKSITINNKPVVKGSGIVLKEPFNYPPLFPTKEWTNTNRNDISSWIHTARDTANTGANDAYSMCMYNYALNNVAASVDTLMSPFVAIKNAASIQLNFWHSYKYVSNGLPNSDSLEVLVSTDCGKSFMTVWKKGGNQLSTTNNTSNTEWYPFSNNAFQQNIIDLSALSIHEKIMIAFRGYNGRGNNLFIDNIELKIEYPKPLDFTKVAVGNNHTVALQSDGTLWTWGLNNSGQLGTGNNDSQASMVQMGNNKWLQIAAGNLFTVAIKDDSTLWAWGNNTKGELGNNTFNNSNTPQQVSKMLSWSNIAVGNSHVLAVQSNGTLWAWGLNDNGQLGDGSFVNKLTPTQIGNDNDWMAIAAGSDHSLAIKKDSTLWSWGANSNGQLGNGTTTINTPTLVDNTKKWKRIAAGNQHSLAIQSNGTLWSWGLNNNGQLGDGTMINKLRPNQITASTEWIEIKAGDNLSIGLQKDSILYTWGNNHLAQLGKVTTTPVQVTPMKIDANSTITNIAASSNSLVTAYINATDKKVCITGNNTNYQLGIGHDLPSLGYGCLYLWMGNIDSNWKNTSNWGNTLPKNNDHVILYQYAPKWPTIQPTDSFQIRSLVIQPNASLKISGSLSIKEIIVAANESIDAKQGKIELIGSALQRIDGKQFVDSTIKQISFNNQERINVWNNFAITEQFQLLKGTLQMNGKKIQLLPNLKYGTAIIAPVLGTIDFMGGSFETQQQFKVNQPAINFITSGIQTYDVIQKNWQNNFGKSSNIGTFITGNNGINNGFDISNTNQPSLFTYNNQIKNWQAVSNTNATKLLAGNVYQLYVPGDRTVDINTKTFQTIKPTTLIASGTIHMGDYFINNSSTPIALSNSKNDFNFLGNPYIAPIEFGLIEKNNLYNNFWLWQPALKGSNQQGGFVAYSEGLGNTFTDSLEETIAPFQIFVVQNKQTNPSILLKENQKHFFGKNNLLIGKKYGIDGKIRVGIALEENGQNEIMADNAVLYFGKDFIKGRSEEDASKLMNPDENISIVVNNELFSIEARKLPNTADSIQIQLDNLQPKNYYLHINTSQIKDTNVTAFLYDALLQKQTPISLTSTTKVFFTIANNTAINKNQRFSIIWRNNQFFNANSAVLQMKILGNYANNIWNLQLNNNIAAPLEIQLLTMNGKVIQTLKYPALTNGNISFKSINLARGVYLLKATAGKKSITIKGVVL